MDNEILKQILDVERQILEEVKGLKMQVEGLDSKVEGLDSKVEGLDGKVEGLDRKVEGLDRKVEGLDRKVEALDKRVTNLEKSNMDMRDSLVRIEAKFDHEIRDIHKQLSEIQTVQKNQSIIIENMRDKIMETHDRQSAIEASYSRLKSAFNAG